MTESWPSRVPRVYPRLACLPPALGRPEFALLPSLAWTPPSSPSPFRHSLFPAAVRDREPESSCHVAPLLDFLLNLEDESKLRPAPQGSAGPAPFADHGSSSGPRAWPTLASVPGWAGPSFQQDLGPGPAPAWTCSPALCRRGLDATSSPRPSLTSFPGDDRPHG